jgi:hypothetical protein
VRFVAGQAEGNRDAALYWACCRALDHGQPDLLPALGQAAQDVGLSQREVDRTIQSARSTGRQTPHATPEPRPAVRLSQPRDQLRRAPGLMPPRKPDAQANPGERDPGPGSRAQVTEPGQDPPKAATPEQARAAPADRGRAATSEPGRNRPFEHSAEREAGE